jgi:hypothetical protein
MKITNLVQIKPYLDHWKGLLSVDVEQKFTFSIWKS